MQVEEAVKERIKGRVDPSQPSEESVNPIGDHPTLWDKWSEDVSGEKWEPTNYEARHDDAQPFGRFLLPFSQVIVT